MRPSTSGFHHVALVSADVRRSAAFYGDVLGFSRVAGGGASARAGGSAGAAADSAAAAAPAGTGAGAGDDFALIMGDAAGTPGTLLAFLERPDERRGRWGVGGVHHVALGTSDEAALLRWKRRLMDAGTAVTGPYDRGWFHSIYFTDPDGQILEIATQGPGYALDEPADALGQREIQPSSFRLRGQRDEAAIAAATHPEPVDAVDEDMALTGIHHVTGITGAIEEADAFYTRALGLRPVKKTFNQDDPATPHWFWARYDGAEVAPHSAWTLFGWRNANYTARAGVGQLHHMAFRADDRQQLDAWREHLAGALRLDVGELIRRGHWVSLPFRAHDGLALEITAPAAGTDGAGT